MRWGDIEVRLALYLVFTLKGMSFSTKQILVKVAPSVTAFSLIAGTLA
jgi:hypothetical protein